MFAQNKTTTLFTLAFIGDAEVNPGANDCLMLGLTPEGSAVALVNPITCPLSVRLYEALNNNPHLTVSILSMRATKIEDRDEIDRLSEHAFRQVDFAYHNINSLTFVDHEGNLVKAYLRGREEEVEVTPPYVREVNHNFFCLACQERFSAETEDMVEVKMDSGRKMVMADCPTCETIVTRLGSIRVRRQAHSGLPDFYLFNQPPNRAYCFQCKTNVGVLNMRAMHNPEKKRPSYKGMCSRCKACVAIPWTRTKRVPMKTAARLKLCFDASMGEDALYDRRAREMRAKEAMAKVS